MNTNKLASHLFFAGLTAICLSTAKLAAQSIPPVPAPTPGVPAPETGPAAQITMGDGTGVNLKLRGRHSRRVRLRPAQRVTILLQYDRSWSGVALDAAGLDGGKVSFPGNRNFIDASGKVVFQFSDAQKPGLYRIALNCGGIASTLQFWVLNPDGSGDDGSLLAPSAPHSSN
jgi:hypothetical protein